LLTDDGSEGEGSELKLEVARVGIEEERREDRRADVRRAAGRGESVCEGGGTIGVERVARTGTRVGVRET
jgi:hypothetical protein